MPTREWPAEGRVGPGGGALGGSGLLGAPSRVVRRGSGLGWVTQEVPSAGRVSFVSAWLSGVGEWPVPAAQTGKLRPEPSGRAARTWQRW